MQTLTIIEVLLSASGLVLFVVLYLKLTRSQIPKGLRLPPGPSGKPLIGNLLDMPTQQQWVTYSKFAKTYGDIVYLNILGQGIIILNSEDLTFELFEKRASSYSDRCEMPMMRDLIGMTWNIVLMPYGDTWRRHRKLAYRSLHPGAAAKYHPIQLKHTRKLIQTLKESPDEFFQHIQHSAVTTMIEILYGIKALSKDDPYIAIAKDGMAALGAAGNPGTFFVDILPILKYVPEWFPGAHFRRQANIWRKNITAMKDVPFNTFKHAMKLGTAEPCIALSLLEDITAKSNLSPDHEDVVQNTLTTLYSASADTTIYTLHTFFLAMVRSQKVQQKAQRELDEVLGDRLPEFKDRPNLPYVDALTKEAIRWHPIGPLGPVHRAAHDDIIGEYFIPKGTNVLANPWHILHKESLYGPEPNEFKPERFLEPGIPYPHHAFGYGRRVCPGRHMADSSIFIVIATILKVYDIHPLKDSDGNEKIPPVSFTSDFLSQPTPFQCDIKPRSASGENLIKQAESVV